MKILHLAVFDRKGGACIAAFRQHRALVENGVDSSMWVRHKLTSDPRVMEYTPVSDMVSRTQRIFRRQCLQQERRSAGVRGEIFDDRSEHGGVETSHLPEHDLINIQFSQDFVDLPSFYRRVSNTLPTVVTLHEMSMFTGGCSYAYACRGFEHRCGNCPLLVRKGPRDLSWRSWHRKLRAYANRPPGMLHFVADSQWLAREALKSRLLSGFPVDVIHYGVDTEIFQPRVKAAARDLLGLPQDRPVIAFAAASLTDERKGAGLLAGAIASLREPPFLLTWGSAFPSGFEASRHLHLGAVDSEHLLSIAYNACDFFVIPSLEEAFGQTCLEAMACGRPVVGFEVGGIPDMIYQDKTGLLVPRADVRGLGEAIQALINNPSTLNRMGHAARELVLDRFTFSANAKSYQMLYEKMLALRS